MLDKPLKFWSNGLSMKRYIIIILILLNFPLFSHEDVKEIILTKLQALKSAVNEQQISHIHYDLALAYYKDQESHLAFTHFLEALKTVPKKTLPEPTSDEKNYYDPALKNYLAHAGKDPEKAAHELLGKYGEIAQDHPEFIQLNFLISTAYANLGQFADFFSLFYQGFPYLHSTHLASKIQGILSLRLCAQSKTVEERTRFQDSARRHLSQALQSNPSDAGLYKTLVFLAKDSNDTNAIHEYLRQIVSQKVVIPRTEIYFYVQEALQFDDFVLGQEIIDQAKSHYNFSRAIKEAQNYLDHLKK